MPVMTKMRDSMPVVFAVLAGIFLLMIIFQWGGQGSLFSGGTDAETLGIVDGTKISRKDYDRIYQAVVEKMKTDANRANLTDIEEEQASDKAWDEAVSEALMTQSMDKMGITVTDQDVRDALFENPPQELRRQFTDSTGVFRQKEYIQQLRDPRNDTIVRNLEIQIRDQIRHMHWQEAVLSTVRVTDDEAKERYLVDSAKAQIQVIKFLAPPVTPEMQSAISDKDAQDYYNSHLWQYKKEERRKFKFVTFRETPNARDTAVTLETAKSIESRLREASLAEVDTVAKEMAADYSDDPYLGRQPIRHRELGSDTSLDHKQTGDVATASIRGKMAVVRILSTADTDRLALHVRKILLGTGAPMAPPKTPGASFERTSRYDTADALARRLLDQARSGADFGELARKNSIDTRSALKGGDLGWNELGYFPPPYQKQLEATPEGGLLGPIDGPEGVEIFQVLKKSKESWTIVGVPLTIKPSRQTLLLQQQMANIFHDQAAKVGFDEAAKNAAYHVVTDAPPAVKSGAPIFSSHAFVDWIFHASKGDISAPIKLLTQKSILVAQVADVIPAGPEPFADVRAKIVQELAKRKALETLSKSVSQFRAMIGPNGDLGAVAAQTRDSSLAPITLSMGPAESVNNLPNSEYVINNWAYSAKVGDVSPVLKGSNGCYIVKLIGTRIPTDDQIKAARVATMKQMYQERVQRLMTSWIAKKKDEATIVDYRVKR